MQRGVKNESCFEHQVYVGHVLDMQRELLEILLLCR